MGSSTGCIMDICCTMVLSTGCRKIPAPPSSPPQAGETYLPWCFLSLLPFLFPWCLQGFSRFFSSHSSVPMQCFYPFLHYHRDATILADGFSCVLQWVHRGATWNWHSRPWTPPTEATSAALHQHLATYTQSTLLKILIALYRLKKEILDTACIMQPCLHFGKKNLSPSRDCTTYLTQLVRLHRVSAINTIKASWVSLWSLLKLIVPFSIPKTLITWKLLKSTQYLIFLLICCLTDLPQCVFYTETKLHQHNC